MAVELTRNIWCDICLGRHDKNTKAEEAAVTVIVKRTQGAVIIEVPMTLDACEEHMDPRISEVVEFGREREIVMNRPSRGKPSVVQPSTPKAKKNLYRRDEKRPRMICLSPRCEGINRDFSIGSGVALHTKMHRERWNEEPAFKPVE